MLEKELLNIGDKKPNSVHYTAWGPESAYQKSSALSGFGKYEMQRRRA